MELVARQRAEGGQRCQHGDRQRGQGGDHRGDDHGAAGDAGLLEAVGDDAGGDLAGLVGAADVVALLDHLLIGHQGLRPVHGGRADEEHGDRETEADGEVRPPQGLRALLLREEVDARRRDQEVRRDEQDGADDAQHEHAGDEALGTLLRGLREIRLAELVRGQTRVREAAALLGGNGAHAACGGAAVEVVVHARIHLAFAPSHTAQPRSRDRTIVHAYRPSVTGPSEPSEMPPGDPFSSSVSR